MVHRKDFVNSFHFQALLQNGCCETIAFVGIFEAEPKFQLGAGVSLLYTTGIDPITIGKFRVGLIWKAATDAMTYSIKKKSIKINIWD